MRGAPYNHGVFRWPRPIRALVAAIEDILPPRPVVAEPADGLRKPAFEALAWAPAELAFDLAGTMAQRRSWPGRSATKLIRPRRSAAPGGISSSRSQMRSTTSRLVHSQRAPMLSVSPVPPCSSISCSGSVWSATLSRRSSVAGARRHAPHRPVADIAKPNASSRVITCVRSGTTCRDITTQIRGINFN